jgi:hypothetical protein
MIPAALLAAALVTPPASAQAARAASVLSDVPAKPDTGARYLIYLHGRIPELQGRDAVSPDFGRYQFDAILGALADRGFTVIAELRNFDAGEAFVEKVAGQVRRLLKAGVPPANVTVAGFSKGGGLATAACATLALPQVNFVFMAGCSKEPAWIESRAGVKGRLLSLYDESDRFEPSCRALFARAQGLTAEKEIVFKTGLDHGLFFAPRPEWLDAISAWSLGTP